MEMDSTLFTLLTLVIGISVVVGVGALLRHLLIKFHAKKTGIALVWFLGALGVFQIIVGILGFGQIGLGLISLILAWYLKTRVLPHIDSSKARKGWDINFNKKKSFIALVGIILIAGIFYWYDLRPKYIKQSCLEQLAESATERNVDDKDTFDWLYEKCLIQRGL